MPIKKNTVKAEYKKVVGRITGVQTEDALTKIAIVGQAKAAALTPVDTSNLINSQYREIREIPGGWVAKVGYTAAYAVFVHEAPGTLLGTNTPRGGAGRGNVWDPDGEPQFLKKGFERDAKEEIDRIIKQEYRN